MQALVSIQIGKPRAMESDPAFALSSKPWRTAIFKAPVSGKVNVGTEGIHGDGQADLKHHGGVDKAICVYPVEHFEYWRQQLNRKDFGNGAFGENFSVAGLEESSVAIGDRWQIGTATFEVSQPRQPCWKLARRWQSKTLAAQAIDSGKTGWYLRVIKTGTIRCDAPIMVNCGSDPSQPRFSIADANDLFYGKQRDLKSLKQLLDVPQLSDAWRSELQAKF